MRLVLCLLKRPTKRKKYRAERPIIVVFEFWSKGEYPYSAKMSPNSVFVSVDVRYILEGVPPIKVDCVTILAQLSSIWDAKGLPQCNLPPNYHPKVKLWGPFGVPGGALGGLFWRMFCETGLFSLIFGDIFSTS